MTAQDVKSVLKHVLMRLCGWKTFKRSRTGACLLHGTTLYLMSVRRETLLERRQSKEANLSNLCLNSLELVLAAERLRMLSFSLNSLESE